MQYPPQLSVSLHHPGNFVQSSMSKEEELNLACERRDLLAVERLLEEGTSPTAPVTAPSSRYYKWMPLHTAIFNAKPGQTAVAERLLR